MTGPVLDKIKARLCAKNLTKDDLESILREFGLSPEFRKNLQLVTEIFGYFIVWMYHMVMIVLLLNLLIAMMSQSYSDIQANADLGERRNRKFDL